MMREEYRSPSPPRRPGQMPVTIGLSRAMIIPIFALLALGAGISPAQQPLFSTDPIWSSNANQRSWIATPGDMDQDGDLDLLVRLNLNALGLCLNVKGPVPFAEYPLFIDDTGSIWAAALGDLDQDGDLDIVVGTSDDRPNAMYLNDGGIFPATPAWESGPSYEANACVLGDVNGDGYLDVVFGNGTNVPRTSPNTLYLNQGGTLVEWPIWESEQKESTYDLALGDVDNDGDLDLICVDNTDNGSSGGGSVPFPVENV
jgi:hypothetical protein